MTAADYPDWAGTPLLGVDTVLAHPMGGSITVPAAGMAGNPATLYTGPVTGISYQFFTAALSSVTAHTTIAAGSGGLSLPQATIDVVSSAGFLAGGGSAVVTTSLGQQAVSYTGVATGQLMGCTGGLGVMTAGDSVEASPVTPFYQISVQSFSGLNLTALEHWILLMTDVSPASANALVSGRGPVKSAMVTMLVKNFDTQPITVSYGLISSGRVVSRDDWRHVSNNIATSMSFEGVAFSTPISEPAGLLLGNSPLISVGPSVVEGRIMPVFAGTQQFTSTVSSQNPAVNLDFEVVVYVPDPNFAAPLQLVWQETFTSGPNWQIGPLDFTMPRMPPIILFNNLSGTTGADVVYTLVGQEFST